MQKSRYYAEKQIVDGFYGGKDMEQIAKELNVPVSRVEEIIRRWTQ